MSDIVAPYLAGLRSSSVEERFKCARMLAQIVERATLPFEELTTIGDALISVALREGDTAVLEAVLNALSSTAHSASSLPLRYSELASLTPKLTEVLLAHAISTLVCSRDPGFLPLFQEYLDDPNEAVRQEAEAGIQSMG
jgi:hypothetical protein